jgi:hypothetical protein
MEKIRVGNYGSYYDASGYNIAISGLGDTLVYSNLDLIYNQTQDKIYYLPVTGKAGVTNVYQDPCTFKNIIVINSSIFSIINPSDNLVLQFQMQETDLDRNLGARVVSPIISYDPDSEELVNTTNVTQSSYLAKQWLKLTSGGVGYPNGRIVTFIEQDNSSNVILCDSSAGIITGIFSVVSSSSGFYPKTGVNLKCASSGAGALVDIVDVETVNYYPSSDGLDIADCQGVTFQISASDGVWTTIEATDETADTPTNWYNITRLGTVTGAPLSNWDSDAKVGKSGFSYFQDSQIFFDYDDINRQKIRVKMPTTDSSNSCYVTIKRKLKFN